MATAILKPANRFSRRHLRVKQLTEFLFGILCGSISHGLAISLVQYTDVTLTGRSTIHQSPTRAHVCADKLQAGFYGIESPGAAHSRTW